MNILNQFTLPKGNVQISLSGGRTSGLMLHKILEANGDLPDRVKVAFANTGREMPETLNFVQEIASRWSVKITWVEDAERGGKVLFDVVSHNSASRNGEPFKRLIQRKKACPDQSKRFCTEHLKILPARRYLIDLGWKQWTNAIGIRADESHRVKPSPDKRVDRWFPLNDAGITKNDVLDFWKKQPFDLIVPAGLGNCDGCFLKSEATLSALARDYPDRHNWWVEIETLATRLTKSPNGARFRSQYTRKELGDFVEKQGDWIFDDQEYLCQKDGGECT
ncbi:MAG: phosphoadenosine phosphosulfate reductase family protein [Rhodobacteraceae bacterium]|nr:phosphoadenosine phosphosulfate reductase family protein [Paracoccaceae bacterium]